MNIICFGQQPCGFYPKDFLLKKIQTARELQKKMSGQIVFFYHDSDHDYRETIVRGKVKGERGVGDSKVVDLNFEQENKIQKKYSPLYLKRIPEGWKVKMLRRLPRFFDQDFIDIFASIEANTVADFCLEVYQKMGILNDIQIIRSSDPHFRNKTQDIDDFFVDIPYQEEIVRARYTNTSSLQLHQGGKKYIDLPSQAFTKQQISAARDDRFMWMQSVIQCTHYIQGHSEKKYMDVSEIENVQFILRSS